MTAHDEGRRCLERSDEAIHGCEDSSPDCLPLRKFPVAMTAPLWIFIKEA
jgi:hypothetical protein